MKKILIFCGVITLVLAMGALNIHRDPGRATHLATPQQAGEIISTVLADATAPNSVDGMNWASCLTTFTEIRPEWNAPSLSFYGYGDGTGIGNPNDATFSYDIYLCDLYGGWECVSSANSGTIGAQRLSHNPETGAELRGGVVDPNYCWADDLNEGTTKWAKTIAYSDYQSTDGRAKTKFDRMEAYGIYVRIYDMTGQSVTSISCVLNGF